MIPCISVENMRRSDAYTIANLVSSLELMHRAARGVFLAGDWRPPVAIIAGSGNNGGDGFALSCILKEHNIGCTVFTMGSKLSADSAFYADRAATLGITVQPYASGCLQGYETLVDCLLGTGFQGTVRENYRVAIEEINESPAYVVSVDINSGMNGNSGDCEIAVHSDLTVTIGFVKNGMVTNTAGTYMKKLICADIGIVLTQEENHICSADEWTQKQGTPGFFLCPDWLEIEPIRSIS